MTISTAADEEEERQKLRWVAVTAPTGGAEGGGGVVCVVGKSALRELLGATRKRAVRRHAKQLASASYFAPLGTHALLSLCHRAVEVEVSSDEAIPLATSWGGSDPMSPPLC